MPSGLNADVVLEPKKAKVVFEHADRLGAKYGAIVAPEEFEKSETHPES